MKFLLKKCSLGILILSLSIHAFANPCHPPKKHKKKRHCYYFNLGKWNFNVEGIYVLPSQQTFDSGGDLVKPNYQWGFSVGTRHGIQCTTYDVALNWTQLIAGGKGDQPTVIAGFPPVSGEITQKISYQFNSVIAEAGNTFNTRGTDIRIALGLEYLSLNYNSNQLTFADGAPAVDSASSVYRTTKTRGLGPHVSTEVQYHFCNSGFSLVGGVSGGLLYASSNSTNTFSGSIDSGAIVTGRIPVSSRYLLTDLYGKLGLRYTHVFGSCRCPQTLSLEGGWKAWKYFDALVIQPSPALAQTNYQSQKFDFSLQGPYLSLQYGVG